MTIFVFSSAKQLSASEFFAWDFALKKTAHIFEYAILYLLIFRATNGKYVQAYLLTILYAISDEVHQHFVPGRTAAVLDLGFDASGANISSYLIWKLKQFRQKRRKK